MNWTCSNPPLQFETYKDAIGPFKQKGMGEEILLRDVPVKRYGIGVLYPIGTKDDEITLDEAGKDGIGNLVPEENIYFRRD